MVSCVLCGSEGTFVGEAVVAAVGDDEVVGEAYVHDLRGLSDAVGQAAVVVAGAGVARGVVVDEYQLGGAAQQGFAQDGAYVGGSLVDASAADADFVDYFSGLVEEEYPELFGSACGVCPVRGRP